MVRTYLVNGSSGGQVDPLWLRTSSPIRLRRATTIGAFHPYRHDDTTRHLTPFCDDCVAPWYSDPSPATQVPTRTNAPGASACPPPLGRHRLPATAWPPPHVHRGICGLGTWQVSRRVGRKLPATQEQQRQNRCRARGSTRAHDHVVSARRRPGAPVRVRTTRIPSDQKGIRVSRLASRRLSGRCHLLQMDHFR